MKGLDSDDDFGEQTTRKIDIGAKNMVSPSSHPYGFSNQFKTNIKFLTIALLIILNLTYTYYTKQSVNINQIQINTMKQVLESAMKDYNNFQTNVKNAINKHVKVDSQKIIEQLTKIQGKAGNLQKQIEIMKVSNTFESQIKVEMQKYTEQLNNILSSYTKSIKNRQLQIKKLDQFGQKLQQFNNILNVQTTQYRQNAQLQTDAQIKNIFNKIEPNAQNQGLRNALMLINHEQQKPELLRKEYLRLQKKYSLNKYNKEQLQFCTLLLTRNNIKNFEYQNSILSIVNQNYTNSKLFIIDDASTDLTPLMIQRFLSKHQIAEDKATLIKKNQQKGDLANIEEGIKSYCSDGDKILVIHGGDTIVHSLAFQVFNAIYHKTNAKVIRALSIDRSGAKQQNSQRLISFQGDNFKQIQEDDLKDDEGEYFLSGYEHIIIPMMNEIACEKQTVISQYLHFPSNGGLSNRGKRISASQEQKIKERIDKYACSTKD